MPRLREFKRSTSGEEVRHLIESLHGALEKHQSVELVPTPVRLIRTDSFGIQY